jgi:hypothetical protein
VRLFSEQGVAAVLLRGVGSPNAKLFGSEDLHRRLSVAVPRHKSKLAI